MASGSNERTGQLRLGFLAAVELRDGGFVGGLLVTDRFGRPLEFQCTTPVKPNRTQELLYGPTLVPFILGELLGRTLIERVSVKPTLIFTSRPEMLELRLFIETPVLCLSDEATDASVESVVRVGTNSFRVSSEFPEDRESATRLAKPVTSDADLSEPIARVDEALRETMKTVSTKPRVA